MSKRKKVIEKIITRKTISFSEAESIREYLDFKKRVTGSQYIFAKIGYDRGVSLKFRKELLPYQTNLLREVLIDHGYE